MPTQGKKTKDRIRLYLIDLEAEVESAAALGGHGQWMNTRDFINEIERNCMLYSGFQLNTNVIAQLLRERRGFPRRMRNGGWGPILFMM